MSSAYKRNDSFLSPTWSFFSLTRLLIHIANKVGELLSPCLARFELENQSVSLLFIRMHDSERLHCKVYLYMTIGLYHDSLLSEFGKIWGWDNASDKNHLK